MSEELERIIEERVEAMGYEFVELERAGSKTRPILRLRVDVAGGSSGEPGTGVSVDDCVRVSRALEEYLDETAAVAERYVLEVSSPGVERPLTRRRDYDRYAGREIALKLKKPQPDGARRIEGELLGLVDAEGQEKVRLRRTGAAAEVVEIPREEIVRANLVFRWKERR
jgi:ribosome maturation factor RimP